MNAKRNPPIIESKIGFKRKKDNTKSNNIIERVVTFLK